MREQDPLQLLSIGIQEGAALAGLIITAELAKNRAKQVLARMVMDGIALEAEGREDS